jgi:hypothetical protein
MDDFDMQQQADEFEADEAVEVEEWEDEEEYEVDDDFPESLEYDGLYGHYEYMDYMDLDGDF